MERVRKPKEYWMNLLEQYEQSEMTQEAFAETHQVNLGTFRSWLYKTRRQQTDNSPTSMHFLQVQTCPESRNDLSLRLSLSGGVLLEFQTLPPCQYLSSLLSLFVKSPC